MWFIAHHEEKEQFLHGGVESLIVTELHDRGKRGSGFRIVQAEDLHVNFEFLVDMFGFSISLRMVGCASKGFETKDSCDFFEDL